jgi:hypothetical protein
MEIILVILRGLESLESLVKLAKNKCESLKSINLAKAEWLVAVRRISVTKTLHLLVENDNHLVEGLLDIRVSISTMLVGVVHLVSKL